MAKFMTIFWATVLTLQYAGAFLIYSFLPAYIKSGWLEYIQFIFPYIGYLLVGLEVRRLDAPKAGENFEKNASLYVVFGGLMAIYFLVVNGSARSSVITTLVFIAQDLFDPRDFSKASVKTIFQKFAEQFSKIDGLSFASSFVAAALFLYASRYPAIIEKVSEVVMVIGVFVLLADYCYKKNKRSLNS